MILVTGSTGFLGKRLCRKLVERGIEHKETSLTLGLDLRNRDDTSEFIKQVKPDYVLNCAAYVGGIQFGYKHPAELFDNNLRITTNLLEACRVSGVRRVVNPISNCAYPASAKLFKEKEFWDGPLHESVMVYGFVRKASWIGSWAYGKQYGLDVINIILSNMYGPDDHFEDERSHALGALIMKIVEAKKGGDSQVVVWGSGKPIREWLHIDDGAEAMLRSLHIDSSIDPINIGVGKGISILELANLIKELVGYRGEIVLDPSKPDGAPYKTVDGSIGNRRFGWSPSIDLREGIKDTIRWYVDNRD